MRIDIIAAVFGLVLFPLCIYSAVLFRRVLRWKRTLADCGVPLGPDCHPILGHILPQRRHGGRSPDYVLECFNTLDVDQLAVIIPVGNFCFIRTRDPRDAQHMLEDNFDNYPKGKRFRAILADFLGEGIFNADGENWYHQRKIGSHLFRTKDLRTTFMRVFEEHTEELCRQLVQASGETASQGSGRPVDVASFLSRFTLDSVGDIIFGRNIGSLKREVPFSKAFDAALVAMFHRLRGISFMIYPRWLSSLIFWRHGSVIRAFTNTIVQEKRVANAEKNADLLSRWIKFADESGNPVTDKFLEDIMINFLLAGRDTTAGTLSWAIYLLAIHPSSEKRLLDELRSVFADGRTPNFDDLKDGASLPFMRAVLDETLRLYGPVYADIKQAIKGDTWPSGVRIPAGASVVWSNWLMCRTDRFWGGGPASEFRPERWLTCSTPSKFDRNIPPVDGPVRHHSRQFIPFQSGPRACIGKHMAMLEMGYALSVLMMRFKFIFTDAAGSDTPAPLGYVTRITLATQPMYMFIQQRQ